MLQLSDREIDSRYFPVCCALEGGNKWMWKNVFLKWWNIVI